MRRDLVVPVLLGLLTLLALPAAGIGPIALSPTTFLRLGLLVSGFVLLVVAPWAGGRGTPGRLLLVAVVAVPFLAFGVLEIPAPPGAYFVPAPAWALVLVAAFLTVLLPARAARALLVGLLVMWAGDALLGRAGAAFLPAGWNPANAPLHAIREAEKAPPVPPAPGSGRGWREGAPIPVEASPLASLGDGAGPWFRPAVRGRFPRAEPLVRVSSGAKTPDPAVLELPGVGVFVPASLARAEHALELDAFDAAVVLSGAWPADAPDAAARADRLAVFTRRGGVLVGPAPGRPWPPPLDRRLGAAGRVPEVGTRAGRTFGLGRVVRAASDEAMRALLRAEIGDAAATHVGTIFDPPVRRPPPLPQSLGRWQDEPAGRRDQGLLLLVYALVAAALDRVLTGRAAARALAAALAVGAVIAGLHQTSPRLPTVRVHAVALDLAGGGGRRVEALAFAAGPAGWAGFVRWEGDGILQVLGADVGAEGRLTVAPNRVVWVVRDRVGRGGAGDLEASPDAAFLPDLLTGALASGRIEVGLSGPLPVRVSGLAPQRAWTLRFRRSGQ